eukprot:9157406-Pyramimonas_sp.AAC.1
MKYEEEVEGEHVSHTRLGSSACSRPLDRECADKAMAPSQLYPRVVASATSPWEGYVPTARLSNPTLPL